MVLTESMSKRENKYVGTLHLFSFKTPIINKIENSLKLFSIIIQNGKSYVEMLKSQNPDKDYPSNTGQKWTDVEENELYVLKGALETLKQSNYPTILFESNNENKELFDYIKEIGYKGIIPVGGYKNMFLTEK